MGTTTNRHQTVRARCIGLCLPALLAIAVAAPCAGARAQGDPRPTQPQTPAADSGAAAGRWFSAPLLRAASGLLPGQTQTLTAPPQAGDAPAETPFRAMAPIFRPGEAPGASDTVPHT